MAAEAVVFAYPKMLFAERELLVAAGGSVYFDQGELRTDRDMMVDYIWVSGYEPANYIGLTFNRWMNINWAVEGGPWWFAQDVVPCTYLQKHWDADRTVNAGLATNLANPVFSWKHKPLWAYPKRSAMSLQWAYPAGHINAGVPRMGVGFDGIGVHSGRRRIFMSDWIIEADAAGTQHMIGSMTSTTLHNMEDEAFLIDRTTLAFMGTNVMTVDHLNFYRVQVLPSWGDPWSETPVPLLMYGPNMSQNNRDLWYQPDGGPFLLKAGKSLKFRMQQLGFGTYWIQVGLVGRVAYGGNNG